MESEDGVEAFEVGPVLVPELLGEEVVGEELLVEVADDSSRSASVVSALDRAFWSVLARPSAVLAPSSASTHAALSELLVAGVLVAVVLGVVVLGVVVLVPVVVLVVLVGVVVVVEPEPVLVPEDEEVQALSTVARSSVTVSRSLSTVC